MKKATWYGVVWHQKNDRCTVICLPWRLAVHRRNAGSGVLSNKEVSGAVEKFRNRLERVRKCLASVEDDEKIMKLYHVSYRSVRTFKKSI